MATDYQIRWVDQNLRCRYVSFSDKIISFWLPRDYRYVESIVFEAVDYLLGSRFPYYNSGLVIKNWEINPSGVDEHLSILGLYFNTGLQNSSALFTDLLEQCFATSIEYERRTNGYYSASRNSSPVAIATDRKPANPDNSKNIKTRKIPRQDTAT